MPTYERTSHCHLGKVQDTASSVIDAHGSSRGVLRLGVRQGILRFEVGGALYRQSFRTDGQHRIAEVVKHICAT